MSEDITVYGEELTVDGYLQTPETNRRRELRYGRLREPAAPRWGHQVLVGRVFAQLQRHVTRHRLGAAAVSPLDVILSEAERLIVQPDVIFIARERRGIIRLGCVWGAPDLVVEVISHWSATYDRGEKLGWYRQYGVREAWLLDPLLKEVEVHDLPANATLRYGEDDVITSTVLPRLRLRVSRLFAEGV